MYSKIKCVYSFCLLFIAVVASAQDSINQKQFAFKTLTINDGLSQNSVIDIAQDSIGYLWLATQDGLNKYDGKRFIHYNKQFEDITRPTFSKLGKVYIDKQNRLWIVTNSGNLELYQPATDDFKTISNIKNVSTLYQDSSLNLYIGTYNSGLFKVDYKSKDTIQVLNPEDTHRSIYGFKETNGNLLVSGSQMVFEIDASGTYSKIKVSEAKNANFSAIAQSNDGTIWLGSFGDGLFYKKEADENFVRFNSNELPKNLNIEDLLIDNKNRLWMATYGNGAYLYDLSSNKLINFKANKNNPFAIHYNDILCLFEDVTGNIWLGTDGTGASYYDEHLIKFNVLTNDQVPKTVNVDVARSITTDKDNNLWIGTSGKGLTRINFNTNDYKTYTTDNSALSSNRIISLSYQDNELWVGHQGFGLNIIDGKGRFNSFPEIKNFTIWRIIQETNHQSWLCTERHGIVLFDKNKGLIKQYNQDNSSLTTNDIKTLVIGKDSTIWIGTEHHGLFKLDRTSETITKIKEVDNKIKSLYFSDDILWIGTNGNGLKQFNVKTESIRTFTTAEGLPNNVIYGILQDLENNLWLSTNNGISKVSANSNTAFEFENFNNNDGLQALEFNTGAYFQDNNGTLYFGGLEGINWFQPKQITFNPTKPKTIITGFQIFTKDQPLVHNLTLKHHQNTATFSFSSLHFSQPERNAYKYQLVNHDEDWVDAGNNNTAHYTNLPPNDYTFKVISSNYDGVWNSTPATYAFTISQPWYLSTYALVCYAFLLVLLIFSIYRYLKWRWHMKMQLQFEQQETERLKQLDEFKTRLYTNISHEFRTPLTLIKGPIEKQLEKSNLNSKDKKELELVHRNSDRLLNLVNQLLDLSKLESGNFKLAVAEGNISALLKQLVAAFEFKAKEKNIHFEHKIQTINKAWFDYDVVEKIVINLLSNAVKYTPENGTIYFESTKQNGQLIITIVNSGNTIPHDELGKLFQRYFQNHKTSDGVGIGLSLVKELAIISHGNIVAHTMNKDDIQFTVTLPIEPSFYNSSEIINKIQVNSEITFGAKSKSKTTNSNSKDKPLLHIVEDDEDVRSFIVSIFESEYRIRESTNGKEGIQNALKEIPDIIISDIMMPKVDGIQLCNTLKQDERTSHIPIILLTAKSGNLNEIEGLKTGADDYVVKPFNTNRLKIRVEKLILLRQKLQQHYSNSFDLKDINPSSVDQQFLNRLNKAFNANYTNPKFNSEQLSKIMAMSRMQLHRKLKALTGLSTTEYIRTQRLKIASKLILNSDLTVSEIAYQVGFNTPSYFIKCFKEMHNCTPLDYASTVSN
ncbi:signal transduction histidine kinase [Flavobacteriaceae bacterium MAR_2010_72]|nr:signal transduction histidine kinase [Flavobacteriaceae bacterium MAR_2010_72]